MRPAGIKDKETTDFSFSELHMCRNFPQGSEKGGGPPTLVHPVHFQRPLCWHPSQLKGAHTVGALSLAKYGLKAR